MRRRLPDQSATASKLHTQLQDGEVLFIGYPYGSNPDGGLYLYPENLTQQELEKRMRPAGSNPITFYAVPEGEM
jgi:hypothetical protein